MDSTLLQYAEKFLVESQKSYFYIKQYLAPTRPYWQPLPSSSPPDLNEKAQPGDLSASEFPFPLQPPRKTLSGKPTIWIAFITAFSILYIFFRHPSDDAALVLPVKPAYIYLAVPTTSTEAHTDLCKTIATAQILGYPIPNVVPYGKTPQNTTLPPSELALSRLSSVHGWLQSLPEQADDGLVILLDNPSTWFQLRPHVLLSRYYEINRSANQRLAGLHNQRIAQTVIFPTQKDCHAVNDERARPSCNPSFDVVSWGNPSPGYLGQGAIIGPVKDLRPLIHKAIAKMNASEALTPAMAFDQIFSEQQLYRERLRTQKGKQEDTRADMEFGIGLDYKGTLSYSASNGPEPIVWGTVGTLSADIISSMTPFWTPSGSEPLLPHDAAWSDVSLLSARGSNTVPAMIHHIPGIHDELREHWWTQLWIGDHARALYTAAERMPATIVASTLDNDGRERVFWNSQPIVEKNGAVVHGAGYKEFTAMCSNEVVASELWRDGKGPWKDIDFGMKLGDLFHN